VSDGGVLVAVAEMALASGIGAELHLSPPFDPAFLFGEHQGTYIVEWVPDEFPESLMAYLNGRGIPSFDLGDTQNANAEPAVVCLDRSQDYDLQWSVTLADLRAAHEGFFARLMGADAALA